MESIPASTPEIEPMPEFVVMTDALQRFEEGSPKRVIRYGYYSHYIMPEDFKEQKGQSPELDVPFLAPYREAEPYACAGHWKVFHIPERMKEKLRELEEAIQMVNFRETPAVMLERGEVGVTAKWLTDLHGASIKDAIVHYQNNEETVLRIIADALEHVKEAGGLSASEELAEAASA